MFVAHTPNSLCSVPHSSHRTDGLHFLYPTSVGGRGACSHFSRHSPPKMLSCLPFSREHTWEGSSRVPWKLHILLLFKEILFIFRERGREGEREGEKHQCVVASRTPPTGDLARNPGMCPDRESNRRPFGLQTSAQSTEPHQPGQQVSYYTYSELIFCPIQ